MCTYTHYWQVCMYTIYTLMYNIDYRHSVAGGYKCRSRWYAQVVCTGSIHSLLGLIWMLPKYVQLIMRFDSA